MKRIMMIPMLIGASITSQADIMISGVFDGPLSGGIPKGVEIYVVNDVTDLSIYGLGSANNGGGSDGQEFTFPGVAAVAGSYIYVASEDIGFGNFLGFAPDYTSAAMSINGDDAIELFENGIVIDVFGDIDTDGSGQPWEYMDGWAYRNNGSERNTSFAIASWQFSGANALDGEVDNASAATPIPLGSFITSDGGAGPGPATQIIINEVDADTEGSDTLEFIELYDGGSGNTDLSGLSMVLFNGSDNQSYQSYDLDGFSTNVDGYFVLGNNAVDNVDLVVSDGSIQNGADAVALLAGGAADYPNDSALPTQGVLDAVVYDTNDADNPTLLALLNAGQPQVNEAGGAGSALESSQRCDNGSGGQRNTDSFIQASPTPGSANNCSAPAQLRLISEIQGNPGTYSSNSFGETDLSPLFGEMVTVEAVVVGDFQDNDGDSSRELNGFFIQEESSDEDGDASSSEGIFVFDNGFGVDVNVGDLVRVTGTVGQFFGESQLSGLSAVEVLDSNKLAQVTAATISLLSSSDVSMSQNGNYQPDLESYEGMLVSIVDTLQITEQFQLDRFNEIKLVAGERPRQFTQDNPPDVDLYNAHQQALGARRITYDDGLNQQNADIANLDGFGDYNESSAKRMGDTVTNLTGILDYKWAGNGASGATWRIRSHLDGSNVFTSTIIGDSPNPRPLSPEALDGTLKIASFNVLNLFTTLDDGATNTAVGLSPRGADDLRRFGVEPATAEFDRQLVKTVKAILAIDADIIGLVEIENEFDTTHDGNTAIEVLVSALNAESGSIVYDYVYPGQQFVGTDAIAVAFLYKPTVVSLAENSSVAVIDDSVAATLGIFASRDFVADPIFDGPATNRVSLATSFTHLTSGQSLTVVANHFKSKGSSGLSDINSPNFDQGNGAGFWDQRRLDAAMAINAWLQSNPTGIETGNTVVLGDLNAYAQEEPVQYLLANGFNSVETSDAYSFVFDGQVGTLDYLLLSDSLQEALAGAYVWHINADEADALDYNLDFGRSDRYFNSSTATRNSDHDPLVIGLNLVREPLTTKALLEEFWQSIDGGLIEGKGRRHIQQLIRVYRFYFLLEKSAWFEQIGRQEKACRVLKKADLRSDGERKPGDWVAGSGLTEFNQLIRQTRSDMACSN